MGGLHQLNEHADHHHVSRPETFICAVCGLHFRTFEALQQHADYLGHYAAEVLQRPAPGTAAREAVESPATAQQQHEQDPTPYATTSSQEDGSDVLMHDVFETLSIEPATIQLLHSTPYSQHVATYPCPQCSQTFCSENAVATHRERVHYDSPHTDAHARDSPYSVYPELHDGISQRLNANGLSVDFYGEGQPQDAIRKYDAKMTGMFTCPDLSCPAKGWPSGHVAVSIRLYEDERYNAVVWLQRCRKCDSMGELQLDEQAYTDRIVYRLSIWLGCEVAPPPFSERRDMPPHLRDLCEGCKSGHCC